MTDQKIVRPERSLEKQLDDLLCEDLASVLNREQTAFDRLAEPFADRIVLFGAGNLGRKTLQGLRRIGIEPLAFGDNAQHLWNSVIDGVQVLSPADAATRFGKNATFVTTVWRAMGGDRQATRHRQLAELGCSRIVSFGYLFWKYPDIFLPHACLDAPHKLYERAGELRQLFQLWADDDSRREYLAQLGFRLRLDFDGLSSPVAHRQYFPDDLYSVMPGEVFVDCGAFDGDTIRDLLARQQNIGKILAFEPDHLNLGKLQAYVSTLPQVLQDKILSSQAPVGRCGQRVRFATTGTVASRVTGDGELEMECVCLDMAAADCGPTFIKMDIEGAEIDALNGGARVIRENRPILAICVYHLPDHLWRIPLLIRELVPDYQFFLRPHDEEGWDLVCYAIPPERLVRKS